MSKAVHGGSFIEIRVLSLARSSGSADADDHVTIGHHLVRLWDRLSRRTAGGSSSLWVARRSIDYSGRCGDGAPLPLSCIPPVVMQNRPTGLNWPYDQDNADNTEFT